MSAEVLARIRAGDERALAELLDAEWPGLVRFLGGRLPSMDAAQDAAQEAFVRLWEKRERWQAGSARGLVYRIAVNVATDLQRRASVRTRWSREEPGTSASPTRPDEALELSEARARYRAAVEALAPKRREVFRLVRDEGLSYREVAEALGLSPQTVANHMSLALRELKGSLADLLPTAGRTNRHTPDATRSNDG